MGRVSGAEARANRVRIGAAAARLFRMRGAALVSIQDVICAVGLTQVGFYKQFGSKDALLDEAIGLGFAEMLAEWHEYERTHEGHQSAVGAALDEYLSTGHRDDFGAGCPACGFAADAACSPTVRATYAGGVRRMAGWLAPGDQCLVILATIVGAVTLSRVTRGTDAVPADKYVRAAQRRPPDQKARRAGHGHGE